MLGGIIGGLIGGAGSIATSAMNMREAEKNRDWQRDMSNTAHQREVADLRAAGLNPVLSSGGQGASTGSGAQASMSDLGSAVSGGMQSGSAYQLRSAQQKNVKAQTDITQADAGARKQVQQFESSDIGKATLEYERMVSAGVPKSMAMALSGIRALEDDRGGAGGKILKEGAELGANWSAKSARFRAKRDKALTDIKASFTRPKSGSNRTRRNAERR